MTSFQIENRERRDGYGWDTYLAISGLADVYDIWYEHYDIISTRMQHHWLRTDRTWGKKDVRSRVVRPLEDIQLVNDPATVQKTAETMYGQGAEDMLGLINRLASV